MSTGADAGVGQPGFVARHGLLPDSAVALASEVAERILTHRLRTVRLAVVDQHGIVRARALSPEAAIAALSNGLDFSGAIYSLDTGNNVFVPPFAAGGGFGIAELTGFPDVVLVPDPGTFQILPWADKTGWLLCDAYFANGQPVPLDGRGLLRRQLAATLPSLDRHALDAVELVTSWDAWNRLRAGQGFSVARARGVVVDIIRALTEGNIT